MAKKIAIAKKDCDFAEDKRSFLIGAIGIRSCGTIVGSANGSAIIQESDRRHYYPPAHAEHRLSRKLNNNSIVFVARVGVGKDNRCFKNARPCDTCIRVMRSRGISCVYYTISDDEYGVIWLKKKR